MYLLDNIFEVTLSPFFSIVDYNFEELESVCLEYKIVANVSGTFGKVRRTSCVMAVGNKNGLIGIAKSKSMDRLKVLLMTKKAAAKRLMYIERLDNRTIYQVDYFLAALFVL